MAVPTLRTHAVGVGSLTIPASVASGDQLVLWIASDSTTLNVPSVTNGTWTHDISVDAVDSRTYQFHRTATGTDAGTSVSFTGTGSLKGLLIPVVGSSGMHAVDGSGSAISADPRSTPPLTTTVADCLVLGFFNYDASSQPGADAWDITSAGWTELLEDNTIAGSRYLSMVVATIEAPSATTVTATADPIGANQESANIIVAFAPSGGGGGSPIVGQYGYGTYGAGNYGVSFGQSTDTTPPTVTIDTALTFKISSVSGKDSYSYQFSPNEAIQAWKIKLVPSSSSIHTAGTQIESGGAVSANADVTGTITSAEIITAGGAGGDNIIKVFAQDSAGNWST